MTAATTVRVGGESFVWELLEQNDSSADAWAHPGATLTVDGETLVAGSSGRSLIRYRGDSVVGRIPVGTIECHGMAALADGSVWIADPGEKLTWSNEWQKTAGRGRVIRVTGDGTLISELEMPESAPWRPTSVAVADFGRGCDGRIFVGDGYGSNVVHCFTRDGDHVWTRTGGEHGKAFQTPHAVCVDDRGAQPFVVVADRGNARLVELTLDGDFVREYGVGELSSPSGLVIRRDILWVAELFGSVRAFDPSGRLVATVGQDDVPAGPWPNDQHGSAMVVPHVDAGAYRSPHGIALDADGAVVVGEWVLGGRVSRLRPVS